MSELFGKIKKALTETEEIENEEVEEVFEEKVSEYEQAQNEKVKRVSNAKMMVKEPRSFDDSTEIANCLLANKACVVNIHRLQEASAIRLLDFLAGVIYAIKGEYQRIDRNVFLFTPHDMPVDGRVEGE
ncbi:MAG TPA: cell division protein SepF [Erysipelotrichaceae bacterium]|jgi:cell division inhibitor SepF|nr:cell division protein SepF [Erysipelotrichia bacterium]HPX32802.1 cell division protein SepF [Erysipelotrichaceae bacterium]HQA85431.1 cell division protein SepF [Erysipelotrichaceae bacterium]